MADLAVINIEVVYDNAPMDKLIKSTAAAEAMVKRLNDAEKAHIITLDEAVRGLHEVEVFLKKNSIAMQDSIRLEKESARVAKDNAAIKIAALKEVSAKAEAAFALSMQRIKEEDSAKAAQLKQISAKAETAFALSMQRIKEEQKEADAIKSKADAEVASYVQTTLAAEKAAAAKAAAFQKGIGGTLGLGSTNASANGGGTGQAFIAQALKEEANERERLAIAEKREADQLEYLNMKYDKAYAAAKLYKSVQDEINLAMSKGVGNADQLQAQLKKLEAEYVAFGAGTTDIKNRFVQQEAAVESSRKGVNKWGLLVQQTGYQAGDFLVQIQSGTNAFVAFGQQATQLVGILPSFYAELGISALALGGITLGLSIAIPLLTAIGAYFTRTSDSAKKAKAELSDLDSAIKGIDDTLKKWTQTKEAAAKGMTVEQMFGGKSLEQAKTDLGVALRIAQEIQKEIEDGNAKNKTGLDTIFVQKLESIWGGDAISRLNAATAAVEEAKKRIAGIDAKLAEEQKQSYDESINSLQEEFNMQVTIAAFGKDSSQVKNLELKQSIDAYNRQIDAQVKFNALTEEQGNQLKGTNKAQQDYLSNAEKISLEEDKKHQTLVRAYEYMGNTMRLSAQQVSNEKEQSDALTQRYAMEMDIAKFGKDSAEVKKRQREDELALYDKGIDKQVLSGQLEKTAGDVLKIRNRARQDEIDLLQKETDALNNGTKLVRDYLNTYLNLGKVIKDASKVDLKEVFQKAINPSSSLYQFVTKTYDMMLNMANMSIRPKLSFDSSSYSEPKQPFGFGSMGGDQVYTAGVGFESTTGTGKDKTTTGTGGGGGIDKVQSLLDSLKTQTEVVDAWYEESQNTLQSASDKELEIIGGRHEAELRLETEHQQRMAAIKEAVKQNNLSIVLGSGAQILSALGAHNEKAARMAKIFGAAQALADTYVGAAAALKLPFPANLAAAASIISAGLGFVSAIKSGSSSSGSLVAREEAARNASIGTSASTQPATPQTVMIQGIKPTDIFTGEQLSTLFDSLYKENRNRGMVFQVAR